MARISTLLLLCTFAVAKALTYIPPSTPWRPAVAVCTSRSPAFCRMGVGSLMAKVKRAVRRDGGGETPTGAVSEAGVEEPSASGCAAAPPRAPLLLLCGRV